MLLRMALGQGYGLLGQETRPETTSPHKRSKRMRWWCWPPALPRPPGCFRCLPAIQSATEGPGMAVAAARRRRSGAGASRERATDWLAQAVGGHSSRGARLTDTAVSGGHVAALLPVLLEGGGLRERSRSGPGAWRGVERQSFRGRPAVTANRLRGTAPAPAPGRGATRAGARKPSLQRGTHHGSRRTSPTLARE